MIKIDMSMPKSCKECPFIDEVQAGCHASGSPGFIPFYDEKDLDKWEQLVATKRDPRCPMHDEHEVCVNCPMNPIRPTWKQGKAYCGQCGKRIPLKIKANYCHKCGREINWLP